jgi:isopentenyl-diphosphate Delta-isomerase
LNDPDEQLEIYDEQGNPTGVAKSRRAIHRDGEWHLAFFCWIVTTDGRVLLQKRAETKDVWPGRWDASAAGHVRFGEGLGGALREIEEELGIQAPAMSELDYLGRFSTTSTHDNGIVCREHQDTFRWRSDRALSDYRPGPEVASLLLVPLSELAALGDTLVPHDPQMIDALGSR